VIEERTRGENHNTSYRETLYRPKPWMPKKRLHKEKLSAKPSLTLVLGPKNLKGPEMSNEIKDETGRVNGSAFNPIVD
jgi:hypothetical protein